MLLEAAILALVQQCAPDVHPHTMATVIASESSRNPFAIGIVDMTLGKQPQTEREAIETATALIAKGANISVGLSQVNYKNFKGLGLTLETAFDPCTNIKAGSSILADCYSRASDSIGEGQEALQAALSCYYSNNFKRGFVQEAGGRASYVKHIAMNSDRIRKVPAIEFNAKDVKEVRKEEKSEGDAAAPAVLTSKQEDKDRVAKGDESKNADSSWDVFGDFPN